MGAVRMLAGFEIRRRWRRVVVLTLLVGVVGAVVLSTVAGARRSESALARFNASSRSANLELTVGDPTASQLRAFAGVKGVDSFARLNTSGDRCFPAPHSCRQSPQPSILASARSWIAPESSRVVLPIRTPSTRSRSVRRSRRNFTLEWAIILTGSRTPRSRSRSFRRWRVRRARSGGSTISATRSSGSSGGHSTWATGARRAACWC